jgi:hypothetical protein
MKELGSILSWRMGREVIGEGMILKVRCIRRIGPGEAILSSEDYPLLRLFLAPLSKQTPFLYSQHVLSK